MAEKIAILAPGGVGGPVGGLLTKAGHDVVLIDQWPAHVEAMKANGLRITIGTKQKPEGEIVVPVRAYHLYEVCTLRQQFDIVILTCKSYDTRWLVHFIEPYLKPDGVLVSMQNSLNDEWISPIIGKHRDIGCVLTGGGELLQPGHVWRNRSMNHPYYTVGELDGKVTARLEELVKILSDAGKTTISTDILPAKWTKLVRNSQSAVSYLCNKRSHQLLDDLRYISAVSEITREAIQIGTALGYNWEPINGLTAESLLGDPERVARNIIENAAIGISEDSLGMVQHDIKVGRPSEVAGYLNGLLVRKGREANLSTPMNEAIVELHLRVERGELPWDESNLDLLPKS